MKRKPSPKKTTEPDNNPDPNLLTFGGHLEVLRRMLFRIIAVVMVLAIAVFCFKDKTFELLLAPSQWDFLTYRYIEAFLHKLGSNFTFNQFHINLIATELSSQFMTHISTALYLGLLGASPYILVELFRFITPALYENEKKYSVQVAATMYLLFIVGVLMSYFILFPIFRHLQRFGNGGKQHHPKILHQHLHHSDFGDGIGVPIARHCLFLGQIGSDNLRNVSELPQIRLPRHHARRGHHHASRPDDLGFGHDSAVFAL